MLIAGIDEAGRGPLAGPVVAAAVVFNDGYYNPQIRDSKQLSAKKREELAQVVKQAAVAWSIVAVGPRRIDRMNIRQATKLAMSLALRRVKADFVLIDGDMLIDTALPQRNVVKGDSLHVEISAASILAKVHRDQLMRVLDSKYPGYGLAKHAGYPTKSHRDAISKLGPSCIHRRTFAGVKEYC
ncbi:MAG: ribonuclease HII [Deltaproteobacteria bacterium]|nr:ribonuclease HII [Deltaproteobacteria bacterium]